MPLILNDGPFGPLLHHPIGWFAVFATNPWRQRRGQAVDRYTSAMDSAVDRSPQAASLGVLPVLAWARSQYLSRAPQILVLLLGWALEWVFLEILVIWIGSPPGRPIWLLLHLGYFWATAYWEAAILRSALGEFDGIGSALRALVEAHRAALAILGLKLVLIPVVLFGLVLAVVPGLFVLARFGLSAFFVAVQGSGPGEALALSRKATQGRTARLMLLSLALLLFNVLGAAALGVGLLITVPMTALAGAYVFRSLTGE